MSLTSVRCARGVQRVGLAAFCGTVATVLLLIFAGRAFAVAAGPYEVSGPTSSYTWTGQQLSITGDGVVIEGMVDASSEPRVVQVASGVTSVTIGSNVAIDTLSVGQSTRFNVTGINNSIATWNSVRGDAIGGTGEITLGNVTSQLDLYGSATVYVQGNLAGAQIWEQAHMVLEPTARVTSILTALGGTLDLSRIPIGSPIAVAGVSVGETGGYTARIVAPFGAKHLDELLSYSNLFVSGSVAVIEQEEQIGTLQSDGSFLITATRTVVFQGVDGAELARETVPLFGAATAPEVKAPQGYRFVGWNRPFDYVTENMVVEALFERVESPTDDTPSNDASVGDTTLPPSQPQTHYRDVAAYTLADTSDDVTWLGFVLPFAVVTSIVALGVALPFSVRT